MALRSANRWARTYPDAPPHPYAASKQAAESVIGRVTERRSQRRRQRSTRLLHVDEAVFEIGAVLHGANRYATLLSVKGAAPVLETKATTGVVAPQRRAGMPTVIAKCGTCNRPTAVLVPGGLRAGESLICPRCVEEASESTATDTSVLSADDLAEADQLGDVELTSEEEYAEALDAEQEWHLRGDGTFARGPRNPWSGNRGAGVGR